MRTTNLIHDALIYDSDDAFLDTVVPFLKDGIDAGEGTVVAASPHNADLVRSALGNDAASVAFVDAQEVYRRPESAIAAYDTVLRQMTAAGYPSVRAIGEVQHGDDRHSRWLPYEPIAHHVFGRRPLWVICPYDVRTLPAHLIDHARRSHPVVRDPDRRRSSDFVEPEALIEMIRPEPTLVPHGPPLVQFSIGGTLHNLRRSLAGNLPAGADDAAILTVVNEIATNAVRHGSGTAYVSMWILDQGVVCDVFDPGGQLDDPFAGYRPPAETAGEGMGLWIARQMSDEFAVLAGRGLTIRLGFARSRQ